GLLRQAPATPSLPVRTSCATSIDELRDVVRVVRDRVVPAPERGPVLRLLVHVPNRVLADGPVAIRHGRGNRSSGGHRRDPSAGALGLCPRSPTPRAMGRPPRPDAGGPRCGPI